VEPNVATLREDEWSHEPKHEHLVDEIKGMINSSITFLVHLTQQYGGCIGMVEK